MGTKIKPVDVQETLSALRQEGCIVTISHVRRFKIAIAIPMLSDEDIDAMDEDGQIPFSPVMTRGQFYSNLKAGRMIAKVKNIGVKRVPANVTDNEPEFTFGNLVSPKGGYTHVRIETPDGQVFEGKRNFGQNEAFVRRHGLQGALTRATIAREAGNMIDSIVEQNVESFV